MVANRKLSASLTTLVGVLLLSAACAEPECPDGYQKDHKVCRRVDSGTQVATDASLEADAASAYESGAQHDAAGSALGDAGNGSDSDASHAAGQLDTGLLGAGDATVAVVDAGPICDAASCVTPCTGSSGASVCAQATLHLCNFDGTSAGMTACASAAQCELGRGRKMCAPCSPGTYRCSETRLEVCSSTGFAWELSKTCATAALCNATAGDCTDAACTTSTRVCEGDSLRGCNATQTELVTLEQCNPGLCDQAGKQCDVCVANARSCSGDTRVVCDATGQTSTRTACEFPTPRCVSSASCVQCTSAGDCATPVNSCQSATCSASGTCGTVNKAVRAPCPSGVCNGSGSCVGCVDATECATKPGKPICNAGTCVACNASNPCSGAHQACINDECITQPYCGDGKLSPGAPYLEQCDRMDPRWNIWTCSADCTLTTTYLLAPCGAGGTCPTGETCVGGFYCAKQCAGNADCPQPPTSGLSAFCSPSIPICFAAGCANNSDCAPGLVCAVIGSGKTACSTCDPQNSVCSAGKTCASVYPGTDGFGQCL